MSPADHRPAPGAVAPGPRMPARLPRAVVFDMDGLMLDTERLDRDLWQAAARERALDIPDALHAALVGRRAADAERTLVAHLGADFPLAEIREQVHARWHAIAVGHGLPRKPGLQRLLAALERARIPKAIATSTPRRSACESVPLGES